MVVKSEEQEEDGDHVWASPESPIVTEAESQNGFPILDFELPSGKFLLAECLRKKGVYLSRGIIFPFAKSTKILSQQDLDYICSIFPATPVVDIPATPVPNNDQLHVYARFTAHW